MHTDINFFCNLFNVQVVPQRKTFAQMMCVRMEECVSASGTPTAVTAQPVMVARIVNKVKSECFCGSVFFSSSH